MTTKISSGQNQTAPVCAVLMPHAPILVPDVAGDRAGPAQASAAAMREAASRVLSFRPDSLILISPHSPRQPGAFGLWSGEHLHGSFAQFNAPGARVSLPNNAPLASLIAAEAENRGLATWMIREKTLDHGALVPLWFLAKAGWTGPTVVLSLADGADGRLESLTTLGQAIAAAARASGRHVAIIASGDMSHRLTHGAPCGFHPRAHQFDETFMALIRDGDYHGIANIPPALRELAAEDASDSTLIAAAAVDWKTTGHEVLNYEAPFGVGYGVAVLFAEEPKPAPPQPAPASATNRQPAINPMLPIPPNPPTPPGQPAVRDGEILPALARQSIAAALTGSSESAPASASPYLSARRGVFVTLRERNGDLRGCAGTFLPSCPNIVEETWRSARLAALQDSRFSPVQARELPNLRFDVSVLHSMEKISSADELDPARYGLLVSTEDGRRALLLPGIEEIKTAEQQLICIRKKGWIGPREPVLMQRFQIDHFEEPK